MEGSYHVSNHVVHHPKHIYKATCLIKRKREHKTSQSGKRQEERTTNYLQKNLLPKKNLVCFFFSRSFSSAEKKSQLNLGLLFSPFSQAALPNVLAKVVLLVCIQLPMHCGL